jgi:hypothetical protein
VTSSAFQFVQCFPYVLLTVFQTLHIAASIVRPPGPVSHVGAWN